MYFGTMLDSIILPQGLLSSCCENCCDDDLQFHNSRLKVKLCSS